jgi:hypothetical protein
MSDSSQPIALSPKEIGFGMVLFEQRKYILLRLKPVLSITAGSLSILLVII